MAVYANLNAFNAGELSPRMIGRFDVSQYSKGCQTLENFMVTPYGSVERRPGTFKICDAATANVRLIRFAFSSSIAYICEFGSKYIRFIYNDTPVINDIGNILEIQTPYSAADLRLLKFVQSADVMTIVHPNHPVMELRRVSANDFELIEKKFEYPPVLDPNLDDTFTIKPSGVSGNITLTASKNAFTSANVGGYYQLVHTRKENEISRDFTSDGVSDSLEVRGYWSFTTHGTWSGNVTIQRSFDNGNTWNDYRSYSSEKDSNTVSSGEEEEEGVLYRIKMEGYAASTTGTLKLCRVHLINPDFITTGIVKITAVTDSLHASGTVISRLGGTGATAEWNEGAWSRRRGYPAAVAFYEERLFFGGSASRPQTVWGSKVGDWDNFLLGDKADSAVEFTLASDTVNTIVWMCQHDSLIIGTADSEWTLSASGSDEALTASNFKLKRQSVYGSTPIAAQMVGETVLFVQRGGRKVREFVFSWEKDGFASPDMTILAEHITAGGIKETVLQQLPDQILWCLLNTGEIAALTYEREQEVVGWQRISTAGKIISCAVIPQGDEDQLYWAVKRASGKVVIERVAPRNFGNIVDAVFLDSAVRADAAAGGTIKYIAGLDHLEGQTVQIFADGAELPAAKVLHGVALLAQEAKTAIAGLGYESLLSPMPIEIETPNGQTVLRNKIIAELRIRIYNSVGGEARAGSDTWQQIYSRDVLDDNMDSAIAAKNEVITLHMQGGYEKTTNIEIRQTRPLPLNVSAIVANYETGE